MSQAPLFYFTSGKETGETQKTLHARVCVRVRLWERTHTRTHNTHSLTALPLACSTLLPGLPGCRACYQVCSFEGLSELSPLVPYTLTRKPLAAITLPIRGRP